MSTRHAVRCRPAICKRRYRHVLRAIKEIASVLLALEISIVLTGCAALGARLSGVSGPIAWHATDLRVVERDVAGAKRDLYAFTLVLEEIQGTAVTFTHAAYTISQPGVNAAGVSEQKALLWKLQPRGELRHPFSFYWYCAELQCQDWGPTAPWWNIILTGTDDRGQPVRVTIDLRLPQNPPGLQIGQPQEPPRTPQPPTASVPTAERHAIPLQIVNNTILVGAVLNHKEYVTLLLDTGATHTLLTPDTAKRLRISPPMDAPKHPVVVTGGQEVEISFTQLSALALGEAVVDNLQVGVASVLPEVPLVDGVLGEDFLQHFSLTLHYATSRLWLEPLETSRTPQPPAASAPAAGHHTVPLQIAHNRIWVRAVLNHKEYVTLLLDTGARHTLLTPDTAAKLGISPTANAPQATTMVFGGRQITFPLVQLSTIAVGDAPVENLQVGVFLALPWAPSVAGVLGGDFLQHFTMTLDHADRRLQLASGAAVGRSVATEGAMTTQRERLTNSLTSGQETEHVCEGPYKGRRIPSDEFRRMAFFIERVNLCGADLRGVSLRRAGLRGASLRGATLAGADLAGARLSGANLLGANLREANLTGAALGGASLSKANLAGANLTRADLSVADLMGAILEGANLSGATLTLANLAEADLRGAQNLTQAQLDMACVDEKTQVPSNLDRPKPCS